MIDEDEPQIFQVEFNEIDGFVYLQTLLFEDIENMPFDGSMPSVGPQEAQERVMWTLNRCVANLDEVKNNIQEKTIDSKIQAAIVLIIYQSCVAINPAIDMVMWNYMIRQKNMYHDLFDTEPLELASISTVLRSTIEKMLADRIDLFDEDYVFPDLPHPAWAPPMFDNSTKEKKRKNKATENDPAPKAKLNKKSILSLKDFMNNNLVGQTEAVDEIAKTLKRSIAGMKDDKRPLGVFLFAGSSGSGKTLAAKLVQQHLYGKEFNLVRVDCSEYQQKHDAMKLIGSPNSYVGYEDGGQLTNAIKRSENTVLLLDEAEKAHRDFWDIFLKVFDEGYLTDNHGDDVSFENTVIIMTSNLGNEKIAQQSFSGGTGFNAVIDNNYESTKAPARSYVERETKAAIHKFFKPEFVNRLDCIVIFNYLSIDNLEKIARLEFDHVATKIHRLGFGFRWNKSAEKALALKSQKAISGAREMAKIRRNLIEDELTERLLSRDIPTGTTFILSAKKHRGEEEYDFTISEERPAVPINVIPMVRKNERN